jgi:hypothetical protein
MPYLLLMPCPPRPPKQLAEFNMLYDLKMENKGRTTIINKVY